MLKVLPILVLIVVLVTFGIFLSPIFTINDIVAVSDNKCVSLDYVKGANLKGQNLLTFQPNNFIKDLKGKYPCVEDVDVQKSFPNTLNINIQTVQPLAIIDGTNLVISSKNILSKANGQQLPSVFLASQGKFSEGATITNPQLELLLME